MRHETGDGEVIESQNIEEVVIAYSYKAFVAFLGVGTAVILSKRNEENEEDVIEIDG